MSLETSAQLRQIAPARWMALGAMLCSFALGTGCGGDPETTTASDTVAPGATTATAASTPAPSTATVAQAASTASIPFPAGLVGTWRRTVTKEDVARAGANSYLVGRCTLTVAAGGEAKVSCAAGPFTGSLIPTADDEVQVAMGTTEPNAYGWVVDGSRLTLTKRDDPTPDRVAAMEGVWQRG